MDYVVNRIAGFTSVCCKGSEGSYSKKAGHSRMSLIKRHTHPNVLQHIHPKIINYF